MPVRKNKHTGANDSILSRRISACTKCPRLVEYCASFRDLRDEVNHNASYCAGPVPGFGDSGAQLLVIGLAPGAHGANRTGRPFTGDAAGEVLYRALHRHGYANQGQVTGKEDGLLLHNVYITNAVKCVPPQNRPSGEEKQTCREWLGLELAKLTRVRLVLAMGKDAFEAYLHLLKEAGEIDALANYRFAHGKVYEFAAGRPVLLATYHFSRYNINTRRLTEEMVEDLLCQVDGLLAGQT
ncbi:MAG: uracil-DNA glycosylase [bacterium]|nr:uracil-DNA glycosylase [bacterium]